MITIKENPINIGNIPQNIPVIIKYELFNETNLPINIEEVGSTCGCSVPHLENNPIMPNEKTNVNVTYNASSLGTNHKSVWIKINGEIINLYFTANVV